MFAASVMKTDFFFGSFAALLSAFFILLSSAGLGKASSTEGEGQVGVEVAAILNLDEQGDKLRYPSSVTYDKDTDETYVVGGGEGRVIVYGANYFPTVSLGKGRGADSPRGVYISKSNMIYLCQAGSEKKSARITVFDPAFFPQKEIEFSSMPEGAEFSPKNMTIGMSGKMYIVGQNNRGVLVLDSDGSYSHWLKPKDKLFTENFKKMKRDDGLELPPNLAAGTEIEPDAAHDANKALNMRDLLPPDLLPTIDEEGAVVAEQELSEVQVADITSDSSGNLYILSEETSKVYIYSQTEEFLFSFGQKGGSTGKMSRPKSLVVDEQKRPSTSSITCGIQSLFLILAVNSCPSSEGWEQGPAGFNILLDSLSTRWET